MRNKPSSRINGTSEKSPQKEKTVSKILEKGKASLSRSKSELGEQHKKMISHWKSSKNELSEQNRKLLANIEQKFKGGSSKKNGSIHKTNENEQLTPNKPPNNNDLDGLMKNLGLDNNIMMSTSMSTSMYCERNPPNNDLEKHLENDYGEFEYIDEGATLTRTLKTNGETVNTDEHRKSMFSFSDEVFDELEKAGTLKKSNDVPDTMDTYETYGAWRQRQKRQKTNQGYYNNNNSVTNNTSAKLQALIADQTLLLRHHKR